MAGPDDKKPKAPQKPKKKPTSVVPAKLELTLVARFASPFTTAKQERDAAAGASSNVWEPSSKDFQAVAETPKLNGAPVTQIKSVSTVWEFMQAITKYPKRSIKRVNLITHGGTGQLALAGRIEKDGTVWLSATDQTQEEAGPVLDRSFFNHNVLDELNKDPYRGERDKVRRRFQRDKSELHLIACNQALGTGVLLQAELSWTFDVKVCAFGDAIWYEPSYNDAQILQRNFTKIGKTGTRGIGYYCAVPVDSGLEGTHLKPPNCKFRDCKKKFWGTDWEPGYV
ncbi:MAG: hypothetical protein JW751_18920 [Polyangiaceae bacterium]|nr:hypothetical protein [Polyangiaceae bacterium]